MNSVEVAREDRDGFREGLWSEPDGGCQAELRLVARRGARERGMYGLYASAKDE